MINILFFLLTTWSSATAPESVAAKLGLGIVNAGGINEVRAQYSGFFLAAALSAPPLSRSALATDIVCCSRRRVRRLARRPSGSALHSMEVWRLTGPPFSRFMPSTPSVWPWRWQLTFWTIRPRVRALAHEISPLPRRFRIRQTATETHQNADQTGAYSRVQICSNRFRKHAYTGSRIGPRRFLFMASS